MNIWFREDNPFSLPDRAGALARGLSGTASQMTGMKGWISLFCHSDRILFWHATYTSGRTKIPVSFYFVENMPSAFTTLFIL